MNNNIIHRNTIYNIIKTISTVVFPVLIFSYVSHVLQPEYIGKINFGNSIVSYASLIASLGISTYASRECSKYVSNRMDASRIASEIYSINVLTTIIAYIILFFFLFLFPSLRDYRLLIIIQSMSIFFNTIGTDWINTAYEDFKYITLRSLLFQIVSLVLAILFVKKPDDYIKYACITAFSTAGSNLLNAIYRKKYCDIKIVRHLNLREHYKPIFILFVLILSQTVFINTDITMIGITKTDYETGLYGTAVKIYSIVSMISTAIYLVVIPQLTTAYNHGDNGTIAKLQRYSLNYIITIGVPSAIGLIVFAPEIITFVAGEKYIDASLSLRILAFGLFFVFFGGGFIGNVILISKGKEQVYAKAYVVASIENFILNLYMIPKYGIIGAALTTVLSELTILAILMIIAHTYIKTGKIYRTIIIALTGSIPFIVIKYVVMKYFKFGKSISLIFSVFLCIVLYFIINTVLKNEFVIETIKMVTKRNRQ